MPKLKPETQNARREHILDAAEACFAQSGFHRTTMHDICKLAGVSPGALYVYFDSKEALIEGLTERDRLEFAERFALVVEASNFLAALRELGDYYMQADRSMKARIGVEIGLEATRNPRIGEIYKRFDDEVKDNFERLFRRLAAEGLIAPAMDIPTLANAVSIIADGMFWRHATRNDTASSQTLPIAFRLIESLLNPTSVPGTAAPAPVSKVP
jgi:TetR/AcrR family transcriptional regulator, repressor for uid operon